MQALFLVQAMLVTPSRDVVHAHWAAAGWGVGLGVCLSHALRGWARSTGLMYRSRRRRVLLGGIGGFAAGLVYASGMQLGLSAGSGWHQAARGFGGAEFGLQLITGTLLCAGWLFLFFEHQSDDHAKNMQTTRARYESALKEAQLRALRGQLNPHFLFNALNVLRRLAATDPSRTRQAITQLAGLLRDSLNGSEQPAIKLAAELRQVDSYLQLEKLRFEERLEIVMAVGGDVLARPIPPFAVLTLVENAVKHGVSTRIAGGRIHVDARAEPDATIVRVTNSGNLPPDPRSGRVGMHNLRERLRLLYGDQAQLRLLEERPGEVVAELRVPAAWPEHGALESIVTVATPPNELL